MEIENIELTENVRVVVRVRPFLQSEARETALQLSRQTVTINGKVYTFDAVMPQHTSQETMYEQAAAELVCGFLRGMNGCVLCYGQTSSGKTHTCGLNEPLSDGLVYRSMYGVFQGLRGVPKEQWELRLSFYQIYNEQIQDLLRPESGCLQLKEVRKNDFQVEGLTEKNVCNLQETISLIQVGLRNRHTAPTLLNCSSSRSHTILQLSLTHSSRTKKTTSRLQILDLAGSERPNKSQAEGMRFTEAVHINQSLGWLGKAVSALSKGLQFVPLRNSVLTKALSCTLMNNCRLVLVATLCPSISVTNESLSTLQFAKSCRDIVQHFHLNDAAEPGVELVPQRLQPEEEMELRELCHAAGLPLSQQINHSDAMLLVERVQEQARAAVEQQAIDKTSLVKLRAEAELAYWKTRVEDALQVRQSTQREPKTALAPSTSEGTAYLSRVEVFVYDAIRDVAAQIDSLQEAVATTWASPLGRGSSMPLQKQLSEIAAGLWMGDTQLHALLENFPGVEQKLEDWVGLPFLRDGGALAQQLSFSVVADQALREETSRRICSQEKEQQEFVTRFKAPSTQAKKSTQKNAFPPISSYVDVHELREALTKFGGALREQTAQVERLCTIAAHKLHRTQQDKTDFFHVLCESGAQLYNFSRMLERLEAAGVGVSQAI